MYGGNRRHIITSIINIIRVILVWNDFFYFRESLQAGTVRKICQHSQHCWQLHRLPQPEDQRCDNHSCLWHELSSAESLIRRISLAQPCGWNHFIHKQHCQFWGSKVSNIDVACCSDTIIPVYSAIHCHILCTFCSLSSGHVKLLSADICCLLPYWIHVKSPKCKWHVLSPGMADPCKPSSIVEPGGA